MTDKLEIGNYLAKIVRNNLRESMRDEMGVKLLTEPMIDYLLNNIWANLYDIIVNRLWHTIGDRLLVILQ